MLVTFAVEKIFVVNFFQNDVICGGKSNDYEEISFVDQFNLNSVF